MSRSTRLGGLLVAALVAAATTSAPGQESSPSREKGESRYAEPVQGAKSAARILCTENGGLFAMRPDGTEVRRILPRTAECTKASWSPDGRHIVFVGEVNDEGRGVYVVRADGEELRKVAPLRTLHPTRPVWSPRPTLDGHHLIVFSDKTEDHEQSYDLFAVRPDGTGLCNVTQTPHVPEKYPTWSPEAERIAFVAEVQRELPPKKARFYIPKKAAEPEFGWVKDVFVSRLVRDADGLVLADRENVTASGRLAFDVKARESHQFESLTWARTQDKLAVVVVEAPRDGSSDVWTIDLARRNVARNVTSTRLMDEVAVGWSPDDSHLVFLRTSEDAERSGICVVPATRRGRHILLQDTLHRVPADWQRTSVPAGLGVDGWANTKTLDIDK